VGALGIINVIITMVTKIGHSHDVHHVFDNIGGSILMWFRLIIVLIFIYGCIRTYRSVRHNLKKFLIKLSLLGFIYIASTPIIVIAANYFIPARNRHEFVFIAVELTKFITNLTFAYELNSKNSEYNRVNLKNASFLPEEERGFK
jgi:glucan phosphoethanolaminetransferase (alkaline phosphatase superfamily)